MGSLEGFEMVVVLLMIALAGLCTYEGIRTGERNIRDEAVKRGVATWDGEKGNSEFRWLVDKKEPICTTNVQK